MLTVSRMKKMNLSTLPNMTYETLDEDIAVLENFKRLVCESIMKCQPQDDWGDCPTLFPDVLAQIEEQRAIGTIHLSSKVVLGILYALITLMSLIGNSLVIVTFIFDKHMRSVTNVFILSLALADLMVTLACVPFNIGTAFTPDWIFGPFACKLVPFFMTFSVACSSLTLCCIALDRYFAIVHPHKFKVLRNPMPAGICLVVIWSVSLSCSVPNAVFYTLRSVEPLCKRDTGLEDRKYLCVWPDNQYKLPLELWMTLIVLFIIPLIIMSTTYGLISYHLWIRKPVGATRRNSLRNADMKKSVIKMLVIVMLAYIICWSPIMVFNSVEKMVKSVNLTKSTVVYIKFYFQCLCMASCCINPVIYTFMNRKFRDKFTTYLCCRNNKVAALGINAKETHTQEVESGVVNTQKMSMGAIVPRSC